MRSLSDGDRGILAEQERDARPGPITPRDVFDALDELGGSADIVAARLLAEGCRGRKNKCDACPLCSDLPPAIAKFVKRFDAGEFPDLEAN